MTTKPNESSKITYTVMASSERYQEFKKHQGSLVYDCKTGKELDLNQVIKRLNALEHLVRDKETPRG